MNFTTDNTLFKKAQKYKVTQKILKEIEGYYDSGYKGLIKFCLINGKIICIKNK